MSHPVSEISRFLWAVVWCLAASTTCAAQSLSVSPSWLSFSYQIGGGIPTPQNLTVSTTSGTTTFSVQVITSPPGWISVSPTSGTTPSSLTVAINPSGLVAGQYRATLQFASPTQSVYRTVSVDLAVTAPPPSFTIEPTSLSFVYAVGGAVPEPQKINLSSSTPLQFIVWSLPAWVTVSPYPSGLSPGTLSVSVNPTLRAPATYTGSFTIEAAFGTGSDRLRRTVAVTLTVLAGPPPPALTAVVNAASFQPGRHRGKKI